MGPLILGNYQISLSASCHVSCAIPQKASTTRPLLATSPFAHKLGGTPYPVIVAISDNDDGITVLIFSYYATIRGRGIYLTHKREAINA